MGEEAETVKIEKQRTIIIINLCLALLLAIITCSVAAYTSLSSAKRVVSTQGTKQLFSSNILYSYDEEKNTLSTRVMSFSSDTDYNSFKFTVCNYAQGDKTAWATKDISYTLSIQLLDSSGKQVTDTNILAEYKLDGVAFSKLGALEKKLVYSSETLTEHSYEITVPSKYMNDYRIQVIAKSDISNYSPIGRIISTTASTASTHWTGTFTDAIVDSTDHKPSELGSVNTKISGQENEIMVIQWDTEYLEIDPWFLADLSDELEEQYTLTEDTENKTKTLKFEVGGEDQPNQYYIIFFRTQSAKSIDETWTQLKAHVSFSYESKSED
jgi:hypothetical protein